MGDIALTWDPILGTADFSLTNGDLTSDNGLKTSAIISLLTDAKASDGDELPGTDGDVRGWWGDEFSEIEGDSVGSKLWLLDRSKLGEGLASTVEEYCREALQWMIDDLVVQRIEFEHRIEGGHFHYSLELFHVDGSTRVNIEEVPKATIPTTEPTFAVPISESGYTGIGFPAPTFIWDMQSLSAPLSELINGIDDMIDVSSSGVTYGNASGLPNGETTIKRTTASGSQLQVADGSVLDVDTDNAIAIGMMVRFDSVIGTNILIGKSLAPGYSFRLNSTGRPWSIIRPVTGVTQSLVGDGTAAQSVGEWHYVIFVLDHRTGFKDVKVINEASEFVADTSLLDTFSDVSDDFGWDTGALAAANTEYVALAAWTGSDVQLLTKELAAAFLEKSGVAP